MATKWLGGVKIERQGCGGETGFASCGKTQNRNRWIKVKIRNKYRIG